jgi:hypothetical protein
MMTTFFSNMEFAKPFFLWLLLALPLLWFRYRDRRLPILIARTVIVALLIFTLADPQLTSEQTRNQERIFAYDFSASITPGMRRWMKETMSQISAPNRNDRIFVFGGAATEVSNWRELFDGGEAKLAGIEPEKTNLENLLTSLLALPAAPRSLYLFTDGWETQGSVERLLPSARAAGIKSIRCCRPSVPPSPTSL